MADKKETIKNLLTRNVELVIERSHLEKALLSGKKLRVKLGIDPTGGNVQVGQKVVPASNIHIGRAVTLWKLKEFQDLGHKIVLIIGDFTAQIGDPSDKLNKRPFLTREQVNANLKNYLPQIGKILDLKKVEVRHNSEWLSKLNFREIAELAETFSVNQMLRRHAFRERWDKGEEISVREFLYPVMQGYDSVMVKADVELGGTDQLFNMMAGREIQKHYGQEPQDVMTTKMLLGTDGRKMSTSWGNVINISDSADEQFGKVMALRDDLILDYFRLATPLLEKEIAAHAKALKNNANPKDVKLVLAKEIVALYHGSAAAGKAAERWEKLFSKKDFSGDMRELKWKDKTIPLVTVVRRAMNSGASKNLSVGEARRLILQGAVKINNETFRNPNVLLTFSGGETLSVDQAFIKLRGGEIVKIGKRNFFRIAI